MQGIFDAYVLWPFDKKFIFELVTYVRIRDYTVCSLMNNKFTIVLWKHGGLKIRIIYNPSSPFQPILSARKENLQRNASFIERNQSPDVSHLSTSRRIQGRRNIWKYGEGREK